MPLISNSRDNENDFKTFNYVGYVDTNVETFTFPFEADKITVENTGSNTIQITSVTPTVDILPTTSYSLVNVKSIKIKSLNNTGKFQITGFKEYLSDDEEEVEIEGISVNVKRFGAKGDGVTDDAPAIQAALNMGGNILFPSGTYLIKSPINILNKSNLFGVPGQSEILINDTFIKGTTLPTNEGAISNNNFSTVYNDSTADSFTIRGLKIIHSTSSNTFIKTSMLFGNTKNVLIEDCHFIANGAGVASNLDIYVASKNIILNKNTYDNLTSAVAGSNLMVRNITASPSSDNVIDGIKITNSTFNKNSSDEILWLCGRDGFIKNILVKNNIFNIVDGGVTPTIVFSVLAREDNGNANAGAENITVVDNIFNVKKFTARIIQIGISANTINTIQNVKFNNNTVVGEVDTTGTSTLIYANTGTLVKNVQVNNNTLLNKGSVKINYGILAGEQVIGNQIKGNFTQSISAAKLVEANYFYDNQSGYAIENCTNVINNHIINYLYGMKFYGVAEYHARGNYLELLDNASNEGIAVINVNGDAPTVYASHNRIKTNNTGSKAFARYIGTLKLHGNTLLGLGTNQYGSSELSAIPTSGSWQVGDIVYNTSPAASGYLGWVCVTAGSPGSWKGFGTIQA